MHDETRSGDSTSEPNAKAILSDSEYDSRSVQAKETKSEDTNPRCSARAASMARSATFSIQGRHRTERFIDLIEQTAEKSRCAADGVKSAQIAHRAGGIGSDPHQRQSK